jgi:hypothetical protein
MTDAGEKALVDDLTVRLVLEPPSPRDAEKMEKRFLNFTYKLVTDPREVAGEVEMAAAGSAPASASAAGGESGVAAQPMTRLVAFVPSESALFAALTGQQELAAAVSGSGGGIGTTAVSTGVGAVIGYPMGLAVRGLKGVLDLVGLNPDVSVRKSEMARRRQTPAPAGAGAQTTGGQQIASGAAKALDNTELTVGKQLGKNLYANAHVILLDSSILMGRTSSSAADNRSNSYGFITDLSYRTSRYKGTFKARWFGLPDDPKPNAQHPNELFLGGEINQSFRGISQKEKFEW